MKRLLQNVSVSMCVFALYSFALPLLAQESATVENVRFQRENPIPRAAIKNAVLAIFAA